MIRCVHVDYALIWVFIRIFAFIGTTVDGTFLSLEFVRIHRNNMHAIIIIKNDDAEWRDSIDKNHDFW